MTKTKSRMVALLLAAAMAASLLLVGVLRFPNGLFASSPTFSDVAVTYWAYDEIERAFDDGVMYGTTHDEATGVRTFTPERTLKVSEFVVSLTRAFYADEVASFEDAYAETASVWYAANTTVANLHNLFNGLGNMRDHMNEPATRYQMAVMMTNIMSDKGFDMPSESELEAVQARIGDWSTIPDEYQDAVATVFAMGLIGGTDSNGTFSGDGNVKRSTMAVIYCRMQDALDGKTPTIDENPDEATEPEKPVETPDENTSTNAYTLANGKPITEENVMALLDELKEKYPDGYTYDPDAGYYSKAFRVTGYDCALMALKISDEIWGDLPVRSHTDFSNIRVGDVLETPNHWCVVIEPPVPNPSGVGLWVKTADGGPTGLFSWMDEWSNKIVKDGDDYVVWTRYPD